MSYMLQLLVTISKEITNIQEVDYKYKNILNRRLLLNTGRKLF